MKWDSLRPQIPDSDSWPIQDLDDLTIVWVAGTILVALLALAWAAYRTVLALRRTDDYSRLLDGVQSADDFAANRRRWVAAQELPLAASYCEMLVEVPRTAVPLERELRRCGSAADVFNPTSLAPGLVGSRLLLAVPAILTGLGVLGTFVGLQLGIKDLDMAFATQPTAAQIENAPTSAVQPKNAPATQDGAAKSAAAKAEDEGMQKMMRSVSELVAGCSTAFATSVWGVVCSLIFTIVEKLLEALCVLRIRRLQRRLDTLIPRYNPEDSMIELQRSAGQQEHILKGLAVAIGEQMQTAMNSLGSSITNAVKDALGGQAQDLGKMSAELMSKALTEELANLQKAVCGMTDDFKLEFGKASETLGTTISGFETVLQKIDSTVQSSRTAMDQAVERLTAHEEVVKNLNDGSTRIKEAAEQLTALRDTFTLSAQRNKEAAQAQEKAAATNEDVAARFEVVGDKLPEVQLAIADGARVIGTLGQPLMDLRELLERTRAIFGEQAEEQSSRDEQRTRVLLAQTETLAKAVADAAAKFAQVESLAVSLEGAAANLQKASNSLGDLGESIQHASRRHEEAASHSERAALAGERAAEKLAPIPDSLETAGRTLTDAGDQIKDGATAARDAYGQLLMHQEEWFLGIKIGLVAMKDQVQSILDTYGSSVEQETQRQMRQWIDAVDESLRKFSTQIQALEGLVSDLSSTNNR